MATMRFTTRISRPVDDVWKAVSVPDTIAEWFTGVISSETHGNIRRVTGGTDGNVGTVEDEIVTSDDQLRRFQYRVAAVEGHLATIDVLEIGSNDTLVIYSVELSSAELAEGWRPYMEGGIKGLKQYAESRAG